MDIFERTKNTKEEVEDSISDLQCSLQLLETEDERFKSSIQDLAAPLPLDLLLEVFSQLPANHLMRLKRMCKECETYISSLRFVKRHLLQSTNSNTRSDKLIFSTDMDGSRIVRICDPYKLFEKFESDVQVGYKPIQPPDCLQFVGSCDGLLCIAGSRNLIVWNPVTSDLKEVPYSDYRSRPRYTVTYGFGCRSVGEDYTIVELSCHHKGFTKTETMFKAYSLRTGNWGTAGALPDGLWFYDFGVFSDGALHWATNTRLGQIISCLDLKSVTYRSIDLPVVHRDYSDYMLRSLRGCLCFLCSYKETRHDMWEMGIYGEKSSWRKLITVAYVSDPEILGQFAAPLYISNGGKLILHIGCKLFVYDMKGSSSSEVNLECIQATTFVESLVSANQKHLHLSCNLC